MKTYMDAKDVKRLMKKFDGLKQGEVNKAIRTGSRNANKLMLKDAKQQAKQISRTGTFERSLKVQSTRRSRVWVGTKVVALAYYSAMIELGTEKIDAKEILTKAAESQRDRAKEVFFEFVDKEIAKIWAKKS